MSDLDISGTVTITGAGQAAKDLNAAAGAATKLATETKKVDTASKSAADKIGAVGSAAGALGSTVGMVNPQLGSMISGLGNVAGAATTMGNAAKAAGLTMSSAFGPIGIAVAAVTALVAAGASAWMDYKDEQKKAADAIRDQVLPTLEQLIAKADEANQKIGLRSRLEQGQGSVTEQQAFLTDLNNQITAKTQQLNLLVSSTRAADMDAGYRADRHLIEVDLERLNSELHRRQGQVSQAQTNLALVLENGRQLAAMQNEIDIAAGEGLINDPKPARTGGGGGRSPRVDAAEDENRRLREVEEERLLDRAETYQRELELLEEHMNNEAEVRDRIRNLEIDESNAAKDRAAKVARDIREAQRDAAELQNEMIKKAAEERRDIITAVEGAIVQSIDMAGQAIVESAKNAGDSEREIAKKQAAATVITSSVKAAIETAESIASFATGNIPGGIGHAAAAAAFIQAAVLAGGQKLPPAESPETGGGGGGTRSPGGGPRRSDTGDRDMVPIVVNIGSSGLVYAADRVQLGRDIDSMVSEARGRGGRGM